MHVSQPIDLIYMGGSIALIALALYWSHAAEGKHGGDDSEVTDGEHQEEAEH
jgi:hypothetical protein